MTAKRSKPTPGHKFQGSQMGFTSSCECGWTSATFFGKGARSEAVSDWQSHVARHKSA